MLASLISLPSAAFSGTASFVANRKKGLAYTAGALGGAYVLGQWAVQKVVEGAEKGRKANWERDDLSRRFSLNLQDSQFTVLALVPTVAAQLQQELDVEARSKALSELARREKERKAEEARRQVEAETARSQAEKEDDKRRVRDEAEAAARTPALSSAGASKSEPQGAGAASSDAPPADSDGTTPSSDDKRTHMPNGVSGVNGAATPEPTQAPVHGAPPSTSLNPSAPAFQPRSASPPAHTAPMTVEPAQTASAVDADGSSSVLGKSWAEVVKTEPPARDAPVVEPAALSSAELNGAESAAAVEPATPVANGEANGVDVEGAGRDAPATPPQPEKSKAELWTEIKLLSLTRLITSLYVLVLLSLQTHVQLALLGRASYVDSLLSSLPPRTPSPAPAASLLSKASLSAPLKATDTDNIDLERALYEAKRLPPTAEERRDGKERERKDLERKYLTFSWWLLHEGWKVVRERVEMAVETVVGPMSLKAPLVYGELGALFGEIRRRIDLEADGKPFDFSAAIHPPTAAQEIQTLVAGGSYVPSPPASSSSTHYFPPSARRAQPDPITPSLRSLLNETNDALDSPDGALVRALGLDRLFALVVEKLEPAFGSASSVGTGEDRGARFEDVTEKQARLAGLLPLVTRLAAGDGGVLASGVNGNEFVEALEDVREMREFSAVLYGSWDRDNIDASCVL